MEENEKELEEILRGQQAILELLGSEKYRQNYEIEEEGSKESSIKSIAGTFTTFYTGTTQQIKEQVNDKRFGLLNKFLYSVMLCEEIYLSGVATGRITEGEFGNIAIAIPAFVDLASRAYYSLKNHTSPLESPNLIGQIKESNLVGKVKEYMRHYSK